MDMRTGISELVGLLMVVAILASSMIVYLLVTSGVLTSRSEASLLSVEVSKLELIRGQGGTVYLPDGSTYTAQYIYVAHVFVYSGDSDLSSVSFTVKGYDLTVGTASTSDVYDPIALALKVVSLPKYIPSHTAFHMKLVILSRVNLESTSGKLVLQVCGTTVGGDRVCGKAFIN